MKNYINIVFLLIFVVQVEAATIIIENNTGSNISATIFGVTEIDKKLEWNTEEILNGRTATVTTNANVCIQRISIGGQEQFKEQIWEGNICDSNHRFVLTKDANGNYQAMESAY